MFKDLFGKTRYKVNLHMHTTVSDGYVTPEDALRIYKEHGYDAVALTDHWRCGKTDSYEGMTVISGVEYNCGFRDSQAGVYHILGLGMKEAPVLDAVYYRDHPQEAQQLIDRIHANGGTVVLAHPAWSLNTPEQILALKGLDATEIYNSVSNTHFSRRPDSSLIVDMVAARGCYLPLLATDDAHYYDGEHCFSFIMAEAEDASQEAILKAVREGNFYASQGPEVHLLRDGDGFTVHCSPCREIVLFSNSVWSKRVFTGDGITKAHYVPEEDETFIRATVIDRDGKQAWTNIIPTEKETV